MTSTFILVEKSDLFLAMMFYVIMLLAALWAMGHQSKFICVHLRSQEQSHNANMELFHLTKPIRTATSFTL